MTLHSGNAILTALSKPSHSLLGHAGNVAVAFWMTCTIERGVCQAVNATCRVLFCVSLVFRDAHLLKEIIKFGFKYWFRVVLSLLNQGVGIQSVASLGLRGLMVTACGFMGLFWFIVYYEERFWAAVWIAVYPFRMSLWAAVQGIALVWLPTLRIAATLLTAGLVFMGAAWFSGFCADPLNLQGTRMQLRRAVGKAEASLGRRRLARIQPGDLPPSIQFNGNPYPEGPPSEGELLGSDDRSDSGLVAEQLSETSAGYVGLPSEAYHGSALTTQSAAYPPSIALRRPPHVSSN